MKLLDRRPWPVRALDRIDASPWGAVLLPLAWLYLGLARVDRWLRPARALAEAPPSIGIGNLRVGGSGKTPVVEDLARRIRARAGLRTHLLARGYGADGGGDEAGWLDQRGHAVSLGADRAASHARAAESGAELVFLDDSLQSRHRPTLQLVLLLEEDLRAMPRPLPAGKAREGRAALRKADALCVRVEGAWPPSESRTQQMQSALTRLPTFVFRLAPRAWVDPQGVEWPLAPLPEALRGPVVVVTGLARPESFEGDLGRLLPDIACALRFADHSQFSEAEIAALRGALEASSSECLVVPEKNRERLLRAAANLPLWTLRSEIEWNEDPCDWILARLFPKK